MGILHDILYATQPPTSAPIITVVGPPKGLYTTEETIDIAITVTGHDSGGFAVDGKVITTFEASTSQSFWIPFAKEIGEGQHKITVFAVGPGGKSDKSFDVTVVKAAPAPPPPPPPAPPPKRYIPGMFIRRFLGR